MWTLPRPDAAAAAQKLSAACLVCSAKARYTLRLFPRSVCFAFAKETRCARRGILSAAGQAQQCRKSGGGSAVFLPNSPDYRSEGIHSAGGAGVRCRAPKCLSAGPRSCYRTQIRHSQSAAQRPARLCENGGDVRLLFHYSKTAKANQGKKVAKTGCKKTRTNPPRLRDRVYPWLKPIQKEKNHAIILFFALRGKISCRLRGPLKTSFSAARRP